MNLERWREKQYRMSQQPTIFELETLAEIMLAVKENKIIYGDLNGASRLPIRNVRRFNMRAMNANEQMDDVTWGNIVGKGKAKGFECLFSEGWRVPDRVYYIDK